MLRPPPPANPADGLLTADADIGVTAALIGERSRAVMLLALNGGVPMSAGELARIARIRPSTASVHLKKLVNGRLLIADRRGRERRYRLAGERVAQALEALSLISPRQRVRTLSDSIVGAALRSARACYDHLAGRLGVALFGALVARQVLQPLRISARKSRRGRSGLGTVALGTKAEHTCAPLGIDLDALQRSERQFATACLDWTENRPHLGGAFGAALCALFLERGWIVRRPKTRALRVTDRGRVEFRRMFGLFLPSEGGSPTRCILKHGEKPDGISAARNSIELSPRSFPEPRAPVRNNRSRTGADPCVGGNGMHPSSLIRNQAVTVVSSFVSGDVALGENDVKRFYAPAVAHWIKIAGELATQLPLEDVATEIKTTFRAEYQRLLLELDAPDAELMGCLTSEGRLDEAKFDVTFEELWTHWLQGTYGLCVRSSLSPRDVLRKELAVARLTKLTLDGKKRVFAASERAEVLKAIREV